MIISNALFLLIDALEIHIIGAFSLIYSQQVENSWSTYTNSYIGTCVEYNGACAKNVARH